MRPRPHPGPVALLLAAWLGVAPPAAAQTVYERVEVGVVELDVSVRDRKGEPIPGLGRESFSVWLGGERLPIEYFAAYADGRRAQGGSEPGAMSAAPPGHLALFFDSSGLDAGERAALVRRLSASLADGLESGARVLIAGRKGDDLEVFQPPTRDPDLLLAGMEAAAAGVPRSDAAAGMHDLLREIERAMSLLDEAQGPSGRGPARVLAARGTVYAAELIQEVGRSTRVVERLVGLMAGLPGRRAILYLGDTLSMNPGELIDGTLRNAFSRFGIAGWTEHGDTTPAAASGSAAIDELADRAASREVVLYTLDPTGDHLPALASAEHSSIEAGRSGGSLPAETWAPGLASRRRTELRGAFKKLAETSGGRIFTGRGQGVLGEVLSDLATYYSLGVRLPAGERRATLPLEIRLADPKLTVERRPARRARTADEVDASRTVCALLAGAPCAAAGRTLDATLSAGPARPVADGRHDVPLTLTVPVAALAVVARDRAHAGQLSLFVATADEGLRFSEVRKIVLPITLTNDELMTVAGSTAEHRIDLRLPAGPARVALGVRDDYDAGLTVLTLELDVGAAAAPPAP